MRRAGGSGLDARGRSKLLGGLLPATVEPCGVSVALGAAWLLAVLGSQAAARAELEGPLVVTQVPGSVRKPVGRWDAGAMMRQDWFDRARLVLVSPSGATRVLSSGFHSAGDPNVSFDGRQLLFAGRKDAGSPWRIYELDLEKGATRPVSPEGQEARSPIYVSTLFTLDSPQPWYTTVYVGRDVTINEAGRPAASSLYNIKLDGTELRRLTFNPNHNFDPIQMWDGRVIYSAERYAAVPGGAGGQVALHAIHVEGADMELYGGELGRRIRQMPCATPGGLVVFVESDRATWDGSGQLACVEERRPHVTYRRLTDDRAWVYAHPQPWRSNEVLVARRPASGRGTWALCRFDASTGAARTVFDTAEFHEIQAQPVRARPSPDGHSTVVTTTNQFGTFYGLNCYDADSRMAPHLKTGMVKRVRLIEGLPQSAAATQPSAAGPGQHVPRRLVGEAPVEADGSFNVEVPADTPLLLQTLDERGLALATCGWIWVKPRESRGCIGCHEDPERIPENEYVLALRRPSTRLTLPPAARRSVGFREEVAPILQRHCAAAECHGGNQTPLRLPLAVDAPTPRDLERAYAALLAPLPGKLDSAATSPLRRGVYVDAGRARTSRLIWQLMGTDTSQPWDGRDPAAGPPPKVKLMPPPGKGRPLTDAERHTLVQWIDLGAPFGSAPSALKPPGEKPASVR